MGRLPFEVTRRPVRFTGDQSRVIVRPFMPGGANRIEKIIRRVLAMSDEDARRLLEETRQRFAGRHKGLDDVFMRHCETVQPLVEGIAALPDERKLLIGSFFTMEYAVESAALFNPSIVPDPDQSGAEKGCLKVIITLRAVGEGHVSSIEFRHAIIDRNNDVFLDCGIGFLAGTPELTTQMTYEKEMVSLRLIEMSVPDDPDSGDLTPLFEANEVWQALAAELGATFCYEDLDRAMNHVRGSGGFDDAVLDRVLGSVGWLAKSNYEIQFPEALSICERVIFPVSQNEVRGIEDARFVRFIDDDGAATNYATYSAYDGQRVQTQILETKDFAHFRIGTMSGRHANSKGMALFPRRVNGQYAMVSRVDGENMFIMFSDDVRFWHDARLLIEPAFPWEFVQIGNCGSPIETEAGWLLLTHGVGPMRRYCIGVSLLDLEDPSRVLAQLDMPLIEPAEHEREGYVPNVVYSCGALIHNGELVIPYAMADTASSVTTVPLAPVLDALRARM